MITMSAGIANPPAVVITKPTSLNIVPSSVIVGISETCIATGALWLAISQGCLVPISRGIFQLFLCVFDVLQATFNKNPQDRQMLQSFYMRFF